MPAYLGRRHLAKLGLSSLVLAGSKQAGATGLARWAYLTPGFTVLIARTIAARGLVAKNHAPMAAPQEYAAVSTYYNDFSAGNMEICIGSWDVFAARYQAGVPIRLLCAITTADMIFILTGNKAVHSVADLRGKTLAAAQSTGTYRMVSAIIAEKYGITLGTDIAIQGVDNPAAAVTLVMADRADGGLSWEPNISAALQRRPDLRTIFNAGTAYREITGTSLPYFGVAVRADWAAANPDAVAAVRRVFADCIADILADPAATVKDAGAGTGFPPAVMEAAITSRRLHFQYLSMTDSDARAAMVTASEFMWRHGLLQKKLDDGFFVAS